MSYPILYLFYLLIITGQQYNQLPVDETSIQENNKGFAIRYKATEAPEWTALFYRTSGWFGADGIFSIAIDGNDESGNADSVLFIFSDTMIGNLDNGKIQTGWSMVNNTVAWLQGSRPDEDLLDFYYHKDEEGKPQSFFVPGTPSAEKGDYYWLGDGFVNTAMNNSIYIFAYRMRNISKKEWGFSEMGNVLIKIPKGSEPPFADHQQIETPLHFDAADPSEKGSFGAGIFANTNSAGTPSPDGFIYIYGVKGREKQLLVARVLPHQFENFSTWRFWDGDDWNSAMHSAEPVAQNVSNELSVSALSDGRYALVYQENGIGNTVGMRIGPTPYGPFGPQMDIWQCSEPKQKNIVTYNAKAHPALSKKGELIISYNVNAFDFLNEIQEHPNLYRPRFIRVVFEQ